MSQQRLNNQHEVIQIVQLHEQTVKYNKDDIVNQKNQDLEIICKICKFLLLDPQQCKQCKQHLCKKCITSSNNKCSNNCNKQFIRPKQKILKKLEQIKIMCKEFQCEKEIKYIEEKKHQEECLYKITDCENIGCSFSGRRFKVAQHSQTDCLYNIKYLLNKDSPIPILIEKEQQDLIEFFDDQFEVLLQGMLYQDAILLIYQFGQIKFKKQGKKFDGIELYLANIGRLSHKLGLQQKALTYFETALVFTENVTGKRNFWLIERLLLEVSQLQKEFNRFQDCLKNSMRILTLREHMFQKDKNYQKACVLEEEIGKVLNQIGILYQYLGQYNLSKDFNKRCYQIRQNLFGNENKIVVVSLINIAKSMMKKGEHEEALQIVQKCIATTQSPLYDQLCRQNDKYVNLNNNNNFNNFAEIQILQFMLADLKMKLFKEDEAKDILNRIFLEPLQPQIEIINPLILKAKLLMKWGNFSEALLNFQQIMEIIQKQGNTIFSNLKEEYFQSDFVLLENPEMMKAEVMNRMSICQIKNSKNQPQNQLSSVQNVHDLLNQSYKIFENYQIKKKMSEIQKNLGIYFISINNPEHAIQHFQRSMELAIRVYGEKGVKYANILVLIGSCYKQLQNYKKSHASYQKGLEIFKEEYNHNNLKIANVQYELSLVDLEMGEIWNCLANQLETFKIYELYIKNNSKIMLQYVNKLVGLGEILLKNGYKQSQQLFEKLFEFYENLEEQQSKNNNYSVINQADISKQITFLSEKIFQSKKIKKKNNPSNLTNDNNNNSGNNTSNNKNNTNSTNSNNNANNNILQKNETLKKFIENIELKIKIPQQSPILINKIQSNKTEKNSTAMSFKKKMKDLEYDKDNNEQIDKQSEFDHKEIYNDDSITL